MKIIIIGCGKVGRVLAKQLNEEKHDLVIIDNQEFKLREFDEEVDAISLTGNGASISTLTEAGVQSADVLIAVTGSDELNLLCCVVAKKISNCQTIARVRNPVYSEEIEFIQERLGISMIVNPELISAREITRLLLFPSAMQIDAFSRGRAELLKFRILPEFEMDGLSISELSSRFPQSMLICAVERDGDVEIPDGNFILKNEDLISVLAAPADAKKFFHQLGLSTRPVKNVLIIGGGKVSHYLAQELLRNKIQVRILEKDKARCEELSELLPEASIINGDSSDQKLLFQSGFQTAEAIVALTNIDEENVFLGLSAKEHNNKAKQIIKINLLTFDRIISKLDVGSVVYPKFITADHILQHIRAIQNSAGNQVETLVHILDNRAEAIEFSVKEGSKVVGVPLKNLKLKKELLICCINRQGNIIIPRGHDIISTSDTVVVISGEKGLHDVEDILERQV